MCGDFGWHWLANGALFVIGVATVGSLIAAGAYQMWRRDD